MADNRKNSKRPNKKNKNQGHHKSNKGKNGRQNKHFPTLANAGASYKHSHKTKNHNKREETQAEALKENKHAKNNKDSIEEELKSGDKLKTALLEAIKGGEVEKVKKALEDIKTNGRDDFNINEKLIDGDDMSEPILLASISSKLEKDMTKKEKENIKGILDLLGDQKKLNIKNSIEVLNNNKSIDKEKRKEAIDRLKTLEGRIKKKKEEKEENKSKPIPDVVAKFQLSQIGDMPGNMEYLLSGVGKMVSVADKALSGVVNKGLKDTVGIDAKGNESQDKKTLFQVNPSEKKEKLVKNLNSLMGNDNNSNNNADYVRKFFGVNDIKSLSKNMAPPKDRELTEIYIKATKASFGRMDAKEKKEYMEMMYKRHSKETHQYIKQNKDKKNGSDLEEMKGDIYYSSKNKTTELKNQDDEKHQKDLNEKLRKIKLPPKSKKTKSKTASISSSIDGAMDSLKELGAIIINPTKNDSISSNKFMKDLLNATGDEEMIALNVEKILDQIAKIKPSPIDEGTIKSFRKDLDGADKLIARKTAMDVMNKTAILMNNVVESSRVENELDLEAKKIEKITEKIIKTKDPKKKEKLIEKLKKQRDDDDGQYRCTITTPEKGMPEAIDKKAKRNKEALDLLIETKQIEKDEENKRKMNEFIKNQHPYQEEAGEIYKNQESPTEGKAYNGSIVEVLKTLGLNEEEVEKFIKEAEAPSILDTLGEKLKTKIPGYSKKGEFSDKIEKASSNKSQEAKKDVIEEASKMETIEDSSTQQEYAHSLLEKQKNQVSGFAPKGYFSSLIGKFRKKPNQETINNQNSGSQAPVQGQ